MTSTAIMLVLFSALVHALWNTFGKKVSPTLGFFSLAYVTGIAPLTPWALDFIRQSPDALLRIMPLLLCSGFFQALYSSALASAYASGQLSVAYPLARALPVLMVALISGVVGISTLNSVIAWCGAVLLILGAVLLPISSWAQWHWRHYLQRSTLFALLAALATTGYSLSDKLALNQLQQSTMLPSLEVAVVYIWLQGIAACLFLFPPQLSITSYRHALIRLIRQQSIALCTTGLMITLTYVLILWAMQISENLSYVVALRQISIPIGALLGIWVFKERLSRLQVVALLLLCCGLVLIALY